MKVLAAIPAYRAARTIEEVVNRIRAVRPNYIDHVVVVDDGSPDQTYQVIKSLPGVTALRHEVNRGYGGAQKTLYGFARSGDWDAVAMLHADGGHLPEELPVLIGELEGGDAAVVVGSRPLGIIQAARPMLGSKLLGAAFRGPMPAHKYIATRLISGFQNVSLGQQLHCWHDGFRIVRRSVLESVPFEQLTEWYDYDLEFLLACLNRGLQVAEVPTSACYRDDAGSTVPAAKYGLRCLSFSFHYHLAKSPRIRLIRNLT